MNTEFIKSRDAQGRHNIRNGKVYFDQIDQDWQLWNDNCHKMVKILVKIVKNYSFLRVNALEWYLRVRKVKKDGKITSKSENEDYVEEKVKG